MEIAPRNDTPIHDPEKPPKTSGRVDQFLSPHGPLLGSQLGNRRDPRRLVCTEFFADYISLLGRLSGN